MMRAVGVVLLAVVLSWAGCAVEWDPPFLAQVAVATVTAYLGGSLGAELGSGLARWLGWSTIDGYLAGIVAGYVGYAVGTTLGAGLGVTLSGHFLNIPGSVTLGFVGAGAGTAVGFGIAATFNIEAAFWLSPPIAAVLSTLGYRWAH